MRLMFIEFLRSSYNYQESVGDINSRALAGFLSYSLQQSLDIAADAANKGHKINDWAAMESMHKNRTIYRYTMSFRLLLRMKCLKINNVSALLKKKRDTLIILRSLAFIDAHRVAQRCMSQNFTSSNNEDESKKAARVVIEESQDEVHLAIKTLESYEIKQIQRNISHHNALIIINKKAAKVQEFVNSGILTEMEAGEFFDETQKMIFSVNYCDSHFKDEEEEMDEAVPVSIAEDNVPIEDTSEKLMIPVTRPARRKKQVSMQDFITNELGAFQSEKSRKRDVRSVSMSHLKWT